VQLVLDGVLDEGTEHDLGARLGISARQLRRLFCLHLGLTPDQLARSVRAHFARRLLDETDLPFAELAFAAGYGSVRQFNRASVEIFRATPTELRARRRVTGRLAADGGLALRLAFEAPLDWTAMLDDLEARAIAGVESVSAGIYRRTIAVDGDPGVLEVWPGGPGHLVLRAHLPRWGGLLHVVRRARRIFGLDADPESATGQPGSGPVAGGLVQSQPGLRPPGTWDPFEAGVAVIAGGAYSPEQAAAILGQIARRHGTPVPGLSQLGLDRMFPGPGVLAAAGLDGLGLDASRITAVRAYARAAARSKVQPDRADDVDEFLDAAEQAAGSWRPWRAHAGAHL
jgi:AraC family transcriptional regulator of adaptative response / DNA-3-methyladenine glycosylase II